jgi:hypothetical protein
MALIRSFTRKARERVSLHGAIEATYSAFERDGRVILQIDSYGSNIRQIRGKQSQSIQLDREGASALYRILKEEFRFD